MRKYIKLAKTLACFAIAGGILAMDMLAFADTIPYDTYNYDYRKNYVLTPAAYVPDSSVGGTSLTYEGSSIGAFVLPEDLVVSTDDKVYVADTGNKRIVVLDITMTNVLEIIDSYTVDGQKVSFKQPTGLAISNSNQLYIADKEAKSIIALDSYENGRELVRLIKDPQSELFPEDFDFAPKKVTVDYADRVYVIAQGKTEGIMAFDEEGEFTSYFGTIKVDISVWQKFWRRIATKKERAQQQLFIATEYTGVDIDDSGFVYATYIDDDGIQSIQRLNPKGADVIVKGENSNLGGDLDINGNTTYSGASLIQDIVYRGEGIYSVIDSRRGRVFTYDDEGNLLYIFGGLGTQAGTFRNPVGVEAIGDKILVLDMDRGEIQVFKETMYGNLINDAVSLRYDGDETQAVAKWQEVLRLDENFELAAVGIGKAYLTSGENKLAMKFLKLGNSRKYYSIAFKRYRNEFLKANLGKILTGVIVLIVVYIIVDQILKRKNIRKKKEEVW